MKMEDIARLAGVSKASVSRVLNNKPNVSQKLKDKIELIMEENDYTPNLVAQALNTNQTKLIGVLLPSIGLDVFSDIVNGISESIARDGYELILADSKGDLEKSKNYLEIFKRKQVDGIIYFPTEMSEDHVEYLNNIKIPLVVVGQAHEDVLKPSISFSDHLIAEEIIHYLNSLGHQRIGYISMPESHAIGTLRKNGYINKMKSLGLEPMIAYASDLSYEAGYLCMRSLLNKNLTAVFGAMDRLIIGAMRCIQDQKLSVPEHYSLAGIDDMDVSKMLNPRLTTVSLNYKRSGELAGRMILDVLNGQNVNSTMLEYEIMKRESIQEV